MKNAKYEFAFVRGLAYVWGRNDQKNETEGRLAGPDVDSYKFATAWAELVVQDTSRPALDGAFDAFRAGRPIAEGRQE